MCGVISCVANCILFGYTLQVSRCVILTRYSRGVVQYRYRYTYTWCVCVWHTQVRVLPVEESMVPFVFACYWPLGPYLTTILDLLSALPSPSCSRHGHLHTKTKIRSRWQ